MVTKWLKFIFWSNVKADMSLDIKLLYSVMRDPTWQYRSNLRQWRKLFVKSACSIIPLKSDL